MHPTSRGKWSTGQGTADSDLNVLKSLQEFCYMVPNGTQLAGTGKRRAIQMANLKAQGLVPGISDMVIAYPTHGYHGAYIEMKRVSEAYAGPAAVRNALRPTQLDWLMKMRSVGYWVAVAYGAEEFKTHVTNYLKGTPQPELKCFRDSA